MFSNLTTRRSFAARLATLFSGAGLVAVAKASAADDKGGVVKLDDKGQPAKPEGFITPVIVHNGVIYIAGQGAHSRGDNSDAGKTPTIEMHAKMVMDNVKACVEAGGGTMDSILQLTVFLTNIDQD